MKTCRGITIEGQKCKRMQNNTCYCYQHEPIHKQINNKNKWQMFSEKDRQDIMKNYNDIVKSNRKCMDYPYEKVKKASSGIHISNETKNQETLCEYIMNAYKNYHEPIFQENSLTSLVTEAIEKKIYTHRR